MPLDRRRWLFLGIALMLFISIFAAMHFIGGEPIYYTNQNRNMSDAGVWQFTMLFLFGGGLFVILGFCGVLFISKE